MTALTQMLVRQKCLFLTLGFLPLQGPTHQYRMGNPFSNDELFLQDLDAHDPNDDAIQSVLMDEPNENSASLTID